MFAVGACKVLVVLPMYNKIEYKKITWEAKG